MNKLLIILLLFAAGSAQAMSVDRRPRKERQPKEQEASITTEAKAKSGQTANSSDTRQKTGRHTTTTSTTKPRYGEGVTLPEMNPTQIDSLVAAWRECQALDSFECFFNTYVDIDPTDAPGTSLPDSVYIQRLHNLVSPVRLSYNNIVRGYINRYIDKRYGTISNVLSRSQYYFPMIEEELLKAGLPVELRALPIIESALSPVALSPVGASGLWQFMPATGKAYGLEVNSLVDERRDPVLATRAACRFLKDLYRIYNDWTLAIAAYNCGPGNVNKAIARSGGDSRSFWDVYDYLPRETRGYVPAFIGASYAYAYHRQHGIEFSQLPLPLATDTIRVNRLLHFGQIASTIDVPIETLRQLNPQYTLDIIPATTKTYTLVLPQRNITQYIQQQDSIFAKDSAYLKEYLNPIQIEKKKTEGPRITYYTVKKGDTLGAIARRYRVTTAQLMRWNGIKNANKLKLGQKLRIEGR